MATKKKNIAKYFVFPITYLILELVEDVLIYKTASMDAGYPRTFTVIGILVFGISIVAFALVPFFQGGLESLRKSHKKHGPLGEVLFIASVLLAIFYLYHVKSNDPEGIEALLPKIVQN